LHIATPLVALVAITLEILMLIRYHESLNLRSILGLVVSALIAIPIGVIYVRQINENIALFMLGFLITAYALYALIGFRLPVLGHSVWSWIFGFLGGLLGGAYNTSGPPAVIYGNCRQWSPQEFKSNLAGYFMIGSIMVVATHALSGNFTSDVWFNFWWTLPSLILGFAIGQSTDKWLNPEAFRRIVLIMLIMLGLRLML
jgi:uncharacterized membrane protein YfcA